MDARRPREHQPRGPDAHLEPRLVGHWHEAATRRRGPERLRVYVGVNEERFVGPRRRYRIISVERRLRARYQEFLLEATPDVLAIRVGKEPQALVIEHTSAGTALASVEAVELAALLVQYVVGHSPSLPATIRALPRTVVLDDLNTGTETPITVSAGRGTAVIEEVVTDLRRLIATPDPLSVATPSETACSRCGYRGSCSVAWHADDDAVDPNPGAPRWT